MHWLRTSITAVGIAVFLAGCGSDDESDTTATSSAASSKATSPIEGRWQTAPISPRDADATLRRYDLEKWIDRFRRVSPIQSPTTLMLTLKDGKWDLYGKSASGSREPIDYNAKYVVRGDKIEKIHATGATTYRWSVKGDTLTFDWISTTEPPSEGIPDEVYSRVLYMTEPYTRQR